MNQSVYDWVGNIPLEMQSVPHFMNCGGSTGKVPINPQTGFPLGKNDENNFLNFGDAKYFTDEDEGYNYRLGFCPRPDDPFVIIDLDFKHEVTLSERDRDLRDGLYNWALENTYVEQSMSGMGYHIVIKGAIPRDINKGTKRGVEVYANKGFVVMTGKRVSKVQGIAHAPEICEWLFNEYAANETEAVSADGDVSEWFDNRDYTAVELQERNNLLKWFGTFSNAAQITRWWDASDFADPSYSRKSEDDAALMQVLYKFFKDHPQRDRAAVRAFLSSPRAQYLTRKGAAYRKYVMFTFEKAKGYIGKEENAVRHMHEAAGNFYDQAMRALEESAASKAQQVLATYTGVPNSMVPPASVPPSEKNPFEFFTASELKARPPIQWAVDDLFPLGGLAALYGESGAGKSFVAIDLIAAIAEGAKWFNIETRQLPVVCLALEGAGGLKQRVAGWEHARSTPEHARAFPESVLFYDGTFNMRDPKDIGMFCAKLNNGHGTFSGVVVIDTMNQAAGGADENSSRDMGELLAGMREIRRLTNSLVIVVHHATKSKENQSMRGHSSFYAACDAVMEVARTEDPNVREWVAVKVKDARDGVCRQFELKEQQLGFDGAKMMTTLAVKSRDPIVVPETGEVIEQPRVERASGKPTRAQRNSEPPAQRRDRATYDYNKPDSEQPPPRSARESEEQAFARLDFKNAIPSAIAVVEAKPEMTHMRGKNGAPPDRVAIEKSILTNAIIDQLNSDFEPDKKFRKKIIDALAYEVTAGRVGKLTQNATTFYWRI
jgi:RecA-family ATPase